MTPETTPEEPLLPQPPPVGSLPPPPPVQALPPSDELFAARPARLPEPTYWPFFMAMGIAFIGWGLISTWIIAVGGLIVFIISLIGWINILRHEHE